MSQQELGKGERHELHAKVPQEKQNRKLHRELKNQVLSRWRDEVRRDPEQSAQILNLDDQELEDHLPALTDKIIAFFEANQFKILKTMPPSTAVSGGRWAIQSFHSCVNFRFFAVFLVGMVREIVGAEQALRKSKAGATS